MNDSLTLNDLDARVRLAKPGSKAKGHADLSIPLGAIGAVRLSGFTIVQRSAGEPLAVLPRKDAR